MIKIYFNPLTGKTIPDAHIKQYCLDNMNKVEHVDEIGSELMLVGYRYAMKKLKTPVENVIFYFKDEKGEYNPYSFDETLKVKNCKNYPSLFEEMLFELL